MEHNLYDNDTDDYYDDDSDTLIMDLCLYTYVCNINKGSNCYFFFRT